MLGTKKIWLLLLMLPSLVWADSSFETALRIYKQHDYALAVVWFEKSAQEGEVKAQNYLAYMYVQGKGLSQNYEQAIYWYGKAAKQGSALAKANLRKLVKIKVVQSCEPTTSRELFADDAHCPDANKLTVERNAEDDDGMIEPDPDWDSY